jgi:hypothetical protein
MTVTVQAGDTDTVNGYERMDLTPKPSNSPGSGGAQDLKASNKWSKCSK